jgi:hypothetical protein
MRYKKEVGRTKRMKEKGKNMLAEEDQTKTRRRREEEEGEVEEEKKIIERRI